MIPSPEQLAAFLEMRPRVLWWGVRRDGSDSILRFEPSLVTQWVTVHVQSTAIGGAGYDPNTSVSSTEYDCRSTRIQDVTVTRNGVDNYTAWLIPMLEAGDGTRWKMDGVSTDDAMTFADLGT